MEPAHRPPAPHRPSPLPGADRGPPGIATNLLTDRLRDLEASGVVERRLAGAGSVFEYALTPWGAELRQPIESLLRWSTPLMVRGPDGDSFRPQVAHPSHSRPARHPGQGPPLGEDRPRDRRPVLSTPRDPLRLRGRPA
ncbi:winged helix-turn-helix transcriptional regulator [Actinophytocola sp. NPDC049390]|uniref:winged helix-turn-helix transcriptional regulator n=1 Tax=Actinophytocola sp. NPDC049390 TaxID=3363894 RepID=UPI0037AB4A5E